MDNYIVNYTSTYPLLTNSKSMCIKSHLYTHTSPHLVEKLNLKFKMWIAVDKYPSYPQLSTKMLWITTYLFLLIINDLYIMKKTLWITSLKQSVLWIFWWISSSLSTNSLVILCITTKIVKF